MAGALKHLIVSVSLTSADGPSTIVKIEERIPVDGSISELSGIFHQVHEFMERIRDGQAGLAERPRVPRGVGACLSANKPEREGG